LQQLAAAAVPLFSQQLAAAVPLFSQQLLFR
jgi:hypothetical protein